MKLITKSILFITVLLFFIGCRKPSGAYWDTDLVVPVVNSKLNIKNFLSDTRIKPDNPGLLYININREVASIKLDSLFNLPDTTIIQSFTVPAIFQLTLTPGQALAFFPPSDLTFDIGNGALLKKVEVKRCVLKAKFSNKLKESLDLIYTIPSATKNGKSFSIVETIPPGEASLVREYDLAGYTLDLRGALGNQFNTINQTYTLSLNANAQPALVNFGDGAKIEFTYSEVVPQFVEGYFGQQLITLPKDTVSFGISQNFKAS
ncbi:MAG: hypothetical protein IT236_13460, partial [Bacteroidia bacterium]|nr:hypothetical protein [Bacteroidia bacterium]